MSAWPEAIYVIKEVKKAIKEYAIPVIQSNQDLNNLQADMRFLAPNNIIPIPTPEPENNEEGNE